MCQSRSLLCESYLLLFAKLHKYTSSSMSKASAKTNSSRCWPHFRRGILGVRSWIWRRECRRASNYLLPHLPDRLPFLWDRKPVLRPLPPGEWGKSSSEEVDVESIEYSPPQSPQYEELLEVVIRAVAKLNIDWPTENQAEPQKSKLDEYFLRIKPLTPCWSLPFLTDLRTEVSRSWRKPFSGRCGIRPRCRHVFLLLGLSRSSLQSRESEKA